MFLFLSHLFCFSAFESFFFPKGFLSLPIFDLAGTANWKRNIRIENICDCDRRKSPSSIVVLFFLSKGAHGQEPLWWTKLQIIQKWAIWTKLAKILKSIYLFWRKSQSKWQSFVIVAIHSDKDKWKVTYRSLWWNQVMAIEILNSNLLCIHQIKKRTSWKIAS